MQLGCRGGEATGFDGCHEDRNTGQLIAHCSLTGVKPAKYRRHRRLSGAIKSFPTPNSTRSTVMGESMRQWQMSAIGRTNLTLAEVPVPAPEPGEVLERVGAASLNYRDKRVVE